MRRLSCLLSCQEKTARICLLVRQEHRERPVPLLRRVREGVGKKAHERP